MKAESKIKLLGLLLFVWGLVDTLMLIHAFGEGVEYSTNYGPLSILAGIFILRKNRTAKSIVLFFSLMLGAILPAVLLVSFLSHPVWSVLDGVQVSDLIFYLVLIVVVYGPIVILADKEVRRVFGEKEEDVTKYRIVKWSLIPVLIGFLLPLAIFALLFAVTNTEGYKTAHEKVSTDPEVIKLMGNDLDVQVTGYEMHSSGGVSTSTYSCVITNPENEVLYAEVVIRNGQEVTRFEIQADDADQSN